MHKAPKLGPIGKGWVQEVKAKGSTRFVIRWNAYVLDGDVRRRISCGPHELGPKVSHGPGLHSLKQAQDAWDKVRWQVFLQHHPTSSFAPKPETSRVTGNPEMKVKDFISQVYEPRRSSGWEDNSRINWEYYRDAFLNPFFGDRTIAQMNDEDLVLKFMDEIADREFSHHTAKKAFTYVKAILDTSRDLGITLGNASRLIPKSRRIPKRIKKPVSQPAISVGQFSDVLAQIRSPRDRLILRILFLCAVRRGELFVLQWKDLYEQDGLFLLTIQRSFCSRTHKLKEWAGKVTSGEGKMPAQVAVPPQLYRDIMGWKQFGDTDGGDPESFIFPTRNGTAIIGTNWAEDVLKPAGERAGIPGVSYHWFRRGHATVQHHKKVADKPIQGQLRHSKVETTREVYMQHVNPETWQAVADLEEIVLKVSNEKSKAHAAAK